MSHRFQPPLHFQIFGLLLGNNISIYFLPSLEIQKSPSLWLIRLIVKTSLWLVRIIFKKIFRFTGGWISQFHRFKFVIYFFNQVRWNMLTVVEVWINLQILEQFLNGFLELLWVFQIFHNIENVIFWLIYSSFGPISMKILSDWSRVKCVENIDFLFN